MGSLNLDAEPTPVPKATLMVEAGIRAEHFAAYFAIASEISDPSGECSVSPSRIAESMNRGVRTARRHLDQLREVGAVEVLDAPAHRSGPHAPYKLRLPLMVGAYEGWADP